MKDSIYFKIIKENYPDEYDILGYTTINKIIETEKSGKTIEILNSDEGSNLDLTSIITFVAGVVQIIDFTLKMVEKRKTKNEKIQTEEVIERLELLPLPEKKYDLSENDYEKIIEDILKAEEE